MMNVFSPVNDLFSPDFNKKIIIESDGGQKFIDEKVAERRQAEQDEREEEKNKFLARYENFKKLGRNELCSCGSGVKYKKCCLRNIEEELRKFRI